MYLGCTSVVVPDGEHLDFEVVRETMAHSAVTVAHFVPSVLSLSPPGAARGAPRAEGPARADRWTRARVCMAAILSMYRLMEVALARRGAADSEARDERPTANPAGARFILNVAHRSRGCRWALERARYRQVMGRIRAFAFSAFAQKENIVEARYRWQSPASVR